MDWVVSFIHESVIASNCQLLSELPHKITSAASVTSILHLMDSSKVCLGNSDPLFLKNWQERSLNLHNSRGNRLIITKYLFTMYKIIAKPRTAFLDDVSVTGVTTIRHANCHFLVNSTSTASRCTQCTQYRPTLVAEKHRSLKGSANPSSPFSHVNYR